MQRSQMCLGQNLRRENIDRSIGEQCPGADRTIIASQFVVGFFACLRMYGTFSTSKAFRIPILRHCSEGHFVLSGYPVGKKDHESPVASKVA